MKDLAWYVTQGNMAEFGGQMVQCVCACVRERACVYHECLLRLDCENIGVDHKSTLFKTVMY